MAFEKLLCTDNWGRWIYNLGPTQVKFTEGESIRVRWPDGQVTEERVRVFTNQVEVYDHGRHETVWSRRYSLVFPQDIHGVKAVVELPLHGMEIERCDD